MKLHIEIWSDIICPFCYIGKTKFEKALQKFEHKDDVDVVMHSYQLYPEMQTQKRNMYELFAEREGVVVKDIKHMYQHVEKMALEAGLQMNIDKAKVINTYNAHRLIQMSNIIGKGNQASDLLFKSYFAKNENTDDPIILSKIGEQLGFSNEEFNILLSSDSFDNEVQADIFKANQLGIKGVPHLLINGLISVNGAQSEEVYLNAMREAWTKTNKVEIPKMKTPTEGENFTTEGF